MLETKITCDGCGELIEGRKGYPINDYIVVGKRDIPMNHTEGVYLISMKPALEGEFHFHSMKCLIKWKKIEETHERLLTIERERAIHNT